MELTYSRWAILNFILLSVFGLLLRYMQVFGLPAANYQFLLHAHSHFAFAGWMFFSIALLIIQSIFGGSFPSTHRKVLLLTQFSAMGMLLTFSFYGYHPVSITFSTLFILTGYWFTYLICRRGNLKHKINPTARVLIHGGLFFLCLSSVGPFALGPLAAAGLKNTELYQDAIYFYLHFQMNGFMLLASLGLFAASSLNRVPSKTIRTWLSVFIVSIVPLFLIFTLWAEPPAWLWILSFAATALHLLSWIKLCVYYREKWSTFPFLIRVALTAISMKTVLQVALCFPALGNWVFQDRNLIIGYVHLLTLGCIMPLILDQYIRKAFVEGGRAGAFLNGLFITAVAFYLSALFVQPLLSSLRIAVPHFQLLLLLISVLFPVTGILYFFRVRRAGSPQHVPAAAIREYDESYADL